MRVDIARHADVRIGVVPVINLEWIQKIHRDRSTRGYSTEAVIDTILRRMPDYVTYICPQFTQTHINFQRVPTVDTSNPFISRWIPTPDESMIVIRFANPRGIDFPYLLSMLDSSFMSRANSIVIPGRQARHRDAAHPDADHSAAAGEETPRGLKNAKWPSAWPLLIATRVAATSRALGLTAPRARRRAWPPMSQCPEYALGTPVPRRPLKTSSRSWPPRADLTAEAATPREPSTLSL